MVMNPEPSTPGSEMFTITTTQVLVILETELDFEVKQDYLIKLVIEDTTRGLTGSLFIKVNLICLFIRFIHVSPTFLISL